MSINPGQGFREPWRWRCTELPPASQPPEPDTRADDGHGSRQLDLDSNLSSITYCVASGNLLNSSVSPFHHLLNEDTKNTHHRSV